MKLSRIPVLAFQAAFAALIVTFLQCDDVDYDNPADPVTANFASLYVIRSLLTDAELPDPDPDLPDPDPDLPSVLRIFGTQQTYNGNLQGAYASPVAAVDDYCESDLNHPGDANFKAMVAFATIRRACENDNCTDPAENIDWVFQPETDYIRLDGTPIMTTNTAGIFDFSGGNLDNAFYAFGAAGNDAYWTSIDGNTWLEYTTVNCDDWQNGTAGDGNFGGDGATDFEAVGMGSTDCFSELSILCVEQP